MAAPNLHTTSATPQLTATYRDPAKYPAGVAYLDGQYLPMSEAKVSVLDWGFLHSDATYDTVHVWDGRFFRLDLHLDRFFNGMRKLHMDIGLRREQVAEVLHNCVCLSGHRNSYVEMICTRGASPTFSRDPRDAVNRFIAFAVPYGSVANADQMEKGLRVAISDAVRIPPSSVDPSIKNYHWLDLVRGLYDAYDKNADTALVLDYEGNIAEGPGFNVFSVKNERLTTPSRNVLPGITRQTVFDLCGMLSMPIEARSLSVEELKASDEIFISSTAGGIMPVTEVDGNLVGDGKVGAITTKLKTLYWDKHKDPDWSSPVDYGSCPTAPAQP